jgi:colanic acid biosynthesis glycosyl transferase WcaI
MARILLHTLIFAPDGVSTAVLLTELALELRALGHEVTVLTTTPHYNVDPEARAQQPLKPIPRWGGMLYQSNCQGIPVYHTFMRSKDSRVWARLLDYARFHVLSLLAGLTIVRDYNVILAPSPPLTIGLTAWLFGLMCRTPFIYNVQEIYPDVAISLGLLKNHYMIRVLQWLERFIYNRSSVVVVISERFRRRLLSKGLTNEKLVTIPNFVDTNFIRPLARCNTFSTTHGLEGQFVILYAGNIGLTQGFETILVAARQLAHLPKLRFLIVGGGTRESWLRDQLAREKLQNVTLLPYQPRSLVPQVYASSDVSLVPLKRGTAQETFPSKIYTIMAAGRPVIASADPDSELAWIIKEAKCGMVVEPDNPEALARVITHAYHENAELQQQGKNGRAYVVAHHSRQAVGCQYDALIRQLVK